MGYYVTSWLAFGTEIPKDPMLGPDEIEVPEGLTVLPYGSEMDGYFLAVQESITTVSENKEITGLFPVATPKIEWNHLIKKYLQEKSGWEDVIEPSWAVVTWGN